MKLLLALALCVFFVGAVQARNKWPDQDDVEVTTKRKMDRSEEDEEEDDSDAFYSFQTDVDDAIKDGLIQRQETRAGKQVTGSYTYEDGYYRRTVQYIADENGYRVVGESATPIGNGPIEDLNGRANVQSSAHGFSTKYTVHGKDINLRKDLLDRAANRSGAFTH